ncbi:MAG: PilN domain-containing protein [Thermodesulfobacteriota bacterium]|nr:PilN domain-containing protein [Thermodesulfobacteriota bacterium]
MIKINLLPYHEEKKRAGTKRQVLIGLVSFGGLLLLVVLFHVHMVMSVARLETEVQSARVKLDTLTKVAGDLEKFKSDKEMLEKKIGIIKDLERDRSYPVHIMDELASRIYPQREWLTSIAKKDNNLRVEGVAVNNPAIAQFMKRLEDSPYIRTVDLISSKQTTVSGVNLMAFVLLCTAEKE